MSDAASFQPPRGDARQKWLFIVLAAGLALVLAWFIYRAFSDVDGVAVRQEPPTVVDMLPPPPPPPPPPPQPQEKPPEPIDNPAPVPDPAPAPVPDKPAPAPMQIDGPAQAGADAYGVSAGRGGGMGAPGSTGTCLGANCGRAAGGGPGLDRFWGRNVANALEQHIERSGKVNVDSFNGEFDVWINGEGTLTQARLARSSGNSRLDQTVLGLLQSARGLRPPPASIRMPQRIKVGRKRL